MEKRIGWTQNKIYFVDALNKVYTKVKKTQIFIVREDREKTNLNERIKRKEINILQYFFKILLLVERFKTQLISFI